MSDRKSAEKKARRRYGFYIAESPDSGSAPTPVTGTLKVELKPRTVEDTVSSQRQEG